MLLWAIVLASVTLVSSLEDQDCWKVNPNMHYTGQGLDQTKDVNELNVCQSLCRASPGCDTIDMDSLTNPQCWTKTKNFQTTERELQNQNGVTNYMTDQRCLDLIEGVDHPCWRVYAGVHYPGLDQVKANDISGCLEKCENNQNCAVVDWDFNTNPNCWNQKNSFKVSLDSHRPHKTVVNFILNRQCFELIKGLDTSFWEVSYDMQYTGEGLQQVDAATLDDCLTLCLESDKCGTVDWDVNTNPHCWIPIKDFTVSRNYLRGKEGVYNFLRRFDRTTLFRGIDAGYWLIRWGYKYEGLQEVSASNFKACVDACLNNDFCFVSTWITDGKCFIQGSGEAVINYGNIKRLKNAITLLARIERLMKFRQVLKFSELPPGPLVKQGQWGSVEILDEDENEPGDEKLGPAFGALGCQNNPVCSGLVKSANLVQGQWYIKWGWDYKGLKETPVKDVKECSESCANSDSCFVMSWVDNKCYIQQDGKAELRSENLEPRNNALTLLGKIKRLFKLKKYRKMYDDENESGDKNLGPAFGELGCQKNPICTTLVQLAGIVRKHWIIKWGSFYKGLKEVQAGSIIECVEICQNNEKCFVLSWAESKCYIQDDGTGELKPENLEARLGVLTLLGRVKRLLRFRKFGKLEGGFRFGMGHFRGGDESKSDDDGGSYDDDDDDDDEESDDSGLPPAFGVLGCQNNKLCSDLVKKSGIARKRWLVKFGKKYKGLKEVPAKGVKECVDTCKNNDNCFVVSWTEDAKCHVQDDGVTDLKPENLEPSNNAVTFLGKVKRLTRFRKFKKMTDAEGFPEKMNFLLIILFGQKNVNLL